MKFQSTPSAWRVTESFIAFSNQIRISIHTLRVEGDIIHPRCVNFITISIHTLRVEGDRNILLDRFMMWQISIHTLRVEGDRLLQPRRSQLSYFNPHPPRGG